MKNNLFIVASDYGVAKTVSKTVADFFSMRLFDVVEMFEFDNAPRTIAEVASEFGDDYVKKEMRSTVKMGFDFDDSVMAINIENLGCFVDLYGKISQKYLVIFLSDKSVCLSPAVNLSKMMFLANLCDIAIDVSGKSPAEIHDETVSEITKYFGVEVNNGNG